jgi:hypothetical protein
LVIIVISLGQELGPRFSSSRRRKHFEPDVSRDTAHHVPDRTTAQGLGRELDLDVVASSELAVQHLQRRGVGDPQGEMMKADYAPTIEWYCALRILGLPQGNHGRAVAEEYRRVVGHFPDLLVTEAFDEEGACLAEVRHGQAHVVDA